MLPPRATIAVATRASPATRFCGARTAQIGLKSESPSSAPDHVRRAALVAVSSPADFRRTDRAWDGGPSHSRRAEDRAAQADRLSAGRERPAALSRAPCRGALTDAGPRSPRGLHRDHRRLLPDRAAVVLAMGRHGR